MNYIKEYYNKIISGEIAACRRVKKTYKKMLNEMDNNKDDFPFVFNEELGERPIIFIETFCKQSQGDLGAPIVLDLFQKAYVQALFGWVEKSTGYRRYNETMLLCGRKNGKSTLLAGIGLYMFVSDGEGAAEIYSVATKKDQARKVFIEAYNMVKQSPELRALIKKRRNDMYFPLTSSIFEALASDSNTLDGLNSHCVIIDELHAIRDRNLYEVMKQSISSRNQPLVVMITTAGMIRECIFDEIYDYAVSVVDGAVEDERFLAVLYELDSRDEWLDPNKWIKANPGLGTIKKVKTLTEFVNRAKNSPADMPGILCKDFNLLENQSASWLSFEQIVCKSTFEIQEVTDTYAIGGCDLSATTDLTCATALIRISRNIETVYVLQHYFIPEKKLKECELSNKPEAPYRKWEERGLLTVCPGSRVDFSAVTQWFVQLRDEYKIDTWKVGYDRALAGYWVGEMQANGFDMEAVAQGPFTFSQPMREMGAALTDKKVNYNDNPILRWCLSNTGVKKSGLNNIQPVKINERRRIDGMVSLLNAWVIYVKYFDDYIYNVG